MGLIRCEQLCQYQADGYCRLNKPHTVNARGISRSGCAFFTDKKQENS